MYAENYLIESLQTCYLFKGILPEELEKILNNYHIRIRKYEKEEYALYAHDVCNDLPLLALGSVRGEMSDFTGRTIKIEDIKAPAALASAFLFGPENKYPVDIIANEASQIAYIAKDSLLKIFRDYPQVMKNFLDDISNRAQFLTRKIRFLTFKTIREKLAHFLMELMRKQQSDAIQIPVTQARLADFFGVTRPSLARALAELVKEGIIDVKRDQVKILNKQKLAQMSNLS